MGFPGFPGITGFLDILGSLGILGFPDSFPGFLDSRGGGGHIYIFRTF